MTSLRHFGSREIAVTAAICAALIPATGGAQVIRPAAPVVRPSTLPGVVRPGGAVVTANAVFGTITQVSGAMLTVKLRDGRSVKVDASVAVAHGDYSAPLFVGKIIVAEGTRRSNGTFDAVRVTRLPSLDQIPADR
jgi:preprotein translocase subunit YajC